MNMNYEIMAALDWMYFFSFCFYKRVIPDVHILQVTYLCLILINLNLLGVYSFHAMLSRDRNTSFQITLESF